MDCHQVLGPMDVLDVFEELQGRKILGKVHLDDYLPKTDPHLDVYILFFYTPHMSTEKVASLSKYLVYCACGMDRSTSCFLVQLLKYGSFPRFQILYFTSDPSLLIHILQEFVWFSSEGVSHRLHEIRKTLHQMSEILVYFAEAA